MQKFKYLSAQQKILRVLLLLLSAALTGYLLFSLVWGIYLVRTVQPLCQTVGAGDFPCGTYAACAALHCTEKFRDRTDGAAEPACTEGAFRYRIRLPRFGSFSYTLEVSASPDENNPDPLISSDAYEIACPLFSEKTYTYSCMVQTAETENSKRAVNHRFQLDAQQQYCSGQSPDQQFSEQDEKALFDRQNTRSAALYQALQAKFGIA